MDLRRSWMGQGAVLAACAAACAILTALAHPPRDGWGADPFLWERDLAVVREWGGSVLWVDARPREKFDAEHIEGALLLNEDEWDALLPAVFEAWSPERRVVVYCDSLGCESGREVAARLRRAGIEPVFLLKGGWDAWKKGAP